MDQNSISGLEGDLHKTTRGARASEEPWEVSIVGSPVSRLCFLRNSDTHSQGVLSRLRRPKTIITVFKSLNLLSEHLNTSSQKFTKTATDINTRPREHKLKPHLSEGVPAVASFLFCVLLVNDVAPCSHSPVKKGFLNHVRLGGEQFCYNGYNLAIFNKRCVTIHYKF